MKKKMNKTLFSMLTLLANVALVSANPVTKGQALSIASKYISNPKLSNDAPKTRSLDANEQPAYYIFKSDNDKKFVIISGESKMNEVVGYGDNMSKGNNEEPPSLKQFLKDYTTVVKAVRANGIQATTTVPHTLKRKVEPLLTSKWGQSEPFNKYTFSYGQRVPCGCVATATAQVMYYHKWPQRRPSEYVKTVGDEAWKSNSYWWNDMKDTGSKMTTERSQQGAGVLLRDIGSAVNMTYYREGSNSNLQYACNALRHKFDYSVRYLDKNVLPANAFLKEVMQELSDGYPILVVGGPHAFVYDGYDEQGFIHINWGWDGDLNGYFDINTVYLNVHGFALNSGTFWDDISVVFAHPNDGKATRFPDIARGLDARIPVAFTIDKTKGSRTDDFKADIKKLGTYSAVKEGLGVFYGKVAVALYNSKNEQVKIFNSISDNIEWASIFTNMSFEIPNIRFENIADGNYRLVPVYSEMLDLQSRKNGEWKPIQYANEMEVEVNNNDVLIKTNNPQNVVIMEKKPSVLSPFYENSGKYAAFSFTMYNPGLEEVRGDLVMTLVNKETKEHFNGFLHTPDVVAQRLGNTSFVIRMLSQYNNPGKLGNLKAGKYDVTFAIKVTKKGSETNVPIDMKEPFEIEVMPDPSLGTIEFTFVDFLVDGENANYSTFQLDKIKKIGLQVHSKVYGWRIKDGYTGPIHYKLLDLTDNQWINLNSVYGVYLPCEQPNNASATRINFDASTLKPNHSYEVHIEIERGGKREDVWNPNVFRNVFYTVDELSATAIEGVRQENKAPKNIFNIAGVRQNKSWEQLPAGIYIVDGKKVMKK